MNDDNLKILEKQLSLQFASPNLIKQAFVHRSYLNESSEFTSSNERLEFLGDAVIELITTKHLYTTYPAFQEGMLTNLRASLVKTTTLSDLSRSLGFTELLLISKGEESTGGRDNSSILADTFEAFVGAVYLDSGIDSVEQILNEHLFPKLNHIIETNAYKDSKSLLQEYTQRHLKLTPTYNLIEESGPDHNKIFKMQVVIGNKVYQTGEGLSKQLAQDDAAAKTLEILQNT